MPDSANPDRLYFTLDEAYRAAESRLNPPKATWGSPMLDRVTGGPRPEGLAVLAGFPRTGKTAFCVRVAVEVVGSGQAVLYAAFDHDLSAIGLRVMGARDGVDIRQIAEKPRGKGLTLPSGGPLYFHTEAFPGTSGLQRVCEQVKRDRGLELVIVDSVRPLLHEFGRADTPRRVLRELMVLHKAMAQNLACQVLSVVSLGDEFGSAVGPGVLSTLSELVGLGLPEHAIDLIAVTDLVPAESHTREPARFRAALLKNRYGPLARFSVPFDEASCSLRGEETPEESPVQYGRDHDDHE